MIIKFVLKVPQCSRDQYKQLTEADRRATHGRAQLNYCDRLQWWTMSNGEHHPSPSWAGKSWYRITGDAGSRITETSPGQYHCGATAAG